MALLTPGNALAGADTPHSPVRIHLPMIAHTSACAFAPCLLWPSDGAAVDTLLPEFRWYAGEDEATTSLICRDPEGPSRYCNFLPEGVTHGAGIQSAHLDYNLAPGEVTTWQVWTTTDGIHYAKSPIWSVRAPANPPLLPAPALIGPSGTIAETTVTFLWEPVTGAETYRFCQRGSVKYASCEFRETTEFTKTLRPDYYSWWVEAKNYYGYSDYNTMTIIIQP